MLCFAGIALCDFCGETEDVLFPLPKIPEDQQTLVTFGDNKPEGWDYVGHQLACPSCADKQKQTKLTVVN